MVQLQAIYLEDTQIRSLALWGLAFEDMYFIFNKTDQNGLKTNWNTCTC